MTAVQSEQRELHAASMQSSDTPTDMTASQKDSSTAGQSDDAAMSGTADAAQPTVSLTSTDAACRKAAACARTVLEAERTILAAASKTQRTYVICPGVLYGELAGRSTLRSTGCPGMGHVLFSAYMKCWRHPNYCSVTSSIHCSAHLIKIIGKAGHCNAGAGMHTHISSLRTTHVLWASA